MEDKELKDIKSDMDQLLRYHKYLNFKEYPFPRRFIRTEEDDKDSSYGNQLAKKYYDSLYKEYTIIDLKYYKQGKVGMRWCTEKEILSGKGRIQCANKGCKESEGLGAYETNFSYIERGTQKNALVKVILCPKCAEKLKAAREKVKRKKVSE